MSSVLTPIGDFYLSIWGGRHLCTYHGLVQKMKIKKELKKDHKSHNHARSH